MSFEVNDLVVGLGHVGLLKITKVTDKKVWVDLLNPQVMNFICSDSCLKSQIRPASEQEKLRGYAILSSGGSINGQPIQPPKKP
ncbi:hypothetical protein JH094_000856 [Acinetobacter baumannii]|uniref:hypothetical protein n=1 Tax=Acinetobacter baumannii TaxID=470 RepID=UPI001CDB6BB4|nr:hypothetical protein [Acinetobacter baumannii]EKX0730842.1 hypothetical protein [Acinetobacter baumannii]EKX0880490.1 hypothetical protein [Acinetobacter baumannii]EKX9067295.1 hypothetical protein [Acinetobacter baumannii]EMF0779073.1 hypothetical protein [Acinetobacter baumannii]MCA4246945.1 hypothetical protein [Acinetobacter baumannii]